jgi:hypothetical protein
MSREYLVMRLIARSGMLPPKTLCPTRVTRETLSAREEIL